MQITIDTVYDGETLRPQSPVNLIPNQHYTVSIEMPLVQTDTQEDA
jgi:hypothetical protein